MTQLQSVFKNTSLNPNCFAKQSQVSVLIFFSKLLERDSFAATQRSRRPMRRKWNAFSQDNGAFMLGDQWQSRHPLIADKTASSTHSAAKFSETPKNRGEKGALLFHY